MITNRSSLLIKNVAFSFLAKGWAAIIVLLMVPLTLKILGIYNNGVWLTISSVVVWIEMMDIGLGNGLRNSIAQYIALNEEDNVRKAMSSAFFMLTSIVSFIFLLLSLSVYNLNVYDLLGIDPLLVPNLRDVLLITFSIGCISFIMKAVGNFYMGIQMPAVNNIIICIGQTLALILTFLLYYYGNHSLLLVVTVNMASPLLIWTLSFLYTFLIRYPQYCPSFKYINWKMSRSLCVTGFQFFILQICGVILFMSTNFIISRVFSPTDVTPYQVAYRYFNIMFIIFGIICMPFWNSTTDAYTQGDIEWIRRTAKKLDLLLIAIASCLIIMVLVSNFVYKIWVGNEIQIPLELSSAVALYIFVLIISLRYSYILNGINILKIQLYFTIAATILFIPLTWIACKLFHSVTTLVLVMCIVNIPGLIANIWKYHQIFYTNEQR